MGHVKVLDRYVFRIYLHGFLAALGIIAGLLIIQRFYKIMELAVSRSLDVAQVVELIAWVLPLILFHSLPIAAIIASLLTFGRLAADSELVAALAAGVSRVRIAALPLAFCFLLALFAMLNNAVLVQMAYVEYDNIGFGVGLDPLKSLKPGVIERIAGRHFGITTIEPARHEFAGFFAVVPAGDAGRAAQGAVSADRWLITAASGRWIFAPPWVTLVLDSGSIRPLASAAFSEPSAVSGATDSSGNLSVNEDTSLRRPNLGTSPQDSSLSAGGRVLSFGRYTLHMPLPIDRSTHPKRLSLAELLSHPARANDLEVARRFLTALAIPPLALCAIMIAFPVGGAGGRSGTGRNAVWHAFLLYLLYWLLSFGAETLVDKYALHPLYLSSPLVILTLIAVSLWRVHP